MSLRKLLDLTGKVALVTGGSRGLGLQIAAGLGEMGARLALTARKADELEAARAALARASASRRCPSLATCRRRRPSTRWSRRC